MNTIKTHRFVIHFAMIMTVIIALSGFSSHVPVAHAEATINRDAWTVDGGISDMVSSGNRLFVGGSFSNVGIWTGHAAAFSRTTGALDRTFPKYETTVNAILPDGVGGWYVGMNSSYNFDDPQLSRTHVLADNTVSPDWQPPYYYCCITAWASYGDTLIAARGGYIWTIDKVTGEEKDLLAYTDYNATIKALAVSGNTLYVGGWFTNASTATGFVTRRSIFALDLITKQILPWNPLLTGDYADVAAIAVADNTVYLGGAFGVVNGQPRTSLAAVDAVTGVLKDWSINTNFWPDVRALLISGNTLYMGGGFSQIGSVQQNSLVAIDRNTAVVSAFNAQIQPIDGARKGVYSLAKVDNTLYIGGEFVTVGGQDTPNLAAIDATTGANLGWRPAPNGSVTSIALSSDKIVVGGEFTLSNSKPRAGLASFDATTGLPENWNPTANSSTGAAVYALALRGSTLYIGGSFSAINGQSRVSLAAIDIDTGNVTNWDPTHYYQASVYEMAFWNDVLFVGGTGSAIFRSLNPTTGADLNITPSGLRYSVHSFVIRNNTVYISGTYPSGITSQGYLTAFEATTGLTTAWQPTSDAPVSKLVLGPQGIYAIGNFTQIGGAARRSIAILDPMTGAATAWNPNPDSNVTGLYLKGNTLYVGGNFTQIGGVARSGIAALDVNTGSATTFNPAPNQSVGYSFYVNGNNVYFGGIARLSTYDSVFALIFSQDTEPLPTPTITPTIVPGSVRTDTIGVYAAGQFFLRNSNTTGSADIIATFGGDPSDLPVAGDWNGDSVDTIGVYRSSTGFYYLSDSNTAPSATYVLLFGNPGDTPFAGRWSNDMTHDGVGVYRNSNGILYQKKALTGGFSDYFAIYGNPGDIGFSGDWNGDGLDSIGIYRQGAWYLTNNSQPAGITYSDLLFYWTLGTSIPVIGDWDGDGRSNPGKVTASIAQFTLSGVSIGAAAGDINPFTFGPVGGKPIAGKWVAGNQSPSLSNIVVHAQPTPNRSLDLQNGNGD